MKKILSVSALVLVLLVGCQSNKSETLDTSKLTKVEMEDVTEEQKEKLPITYEAPSEKVGLDALPFEMKLPKKLPFDAKPFQPPIIDDMNHDGKKLKVEFNTFSKNQNKRIDLMIIVFNEEQKIDNTNIEQIKLKDGIIAYYSDQKLHFNKDGISYTIIYMNLKIPVEQHKKEIIEIANQMIN